MLRDLSKSCDLTSGNYYFWVAVFFFLVELVTGGFLYQQV